MIPNVIEITDEASFVTNEKLIVAPTAMKKSPGQPKINMWIFHLVIKKQII